MDEQHFPSKFIDDLASIDPHDNYFIPVWDSVFQQGIKPRLMLDVACGNGVFALYAKKVTGCRLHGVDGSEYALSIARQHGFERLERIGDFNRDHLPFDSGFFDFCLCKDLLEHLTDPGFVLSEIHRVLASDGHCLLHVPNHFPLYGRLKFLFSNDIDTFRYFPGAKRWNFPHIRFFTYESLIELETEKRFCLVADLSHHFSVLPLVGRIPMGRALKRVLAQWNPSQFSEGVTLLLAKA